MRIAIPTVLCLFAASAAAQTLLVLPAEYDRAWGRGSSSALGGSATRTQMVFANPFPVGTVILGIGLRDSTGALNDAAFTADVEITLSSTSATPGALSSTFASNVGSDALTVLPRQIVPIAAMPANRSTGLFAQIPFTTPFVFGLNAQPNILVDLKVFGRTGGAGWSTDRMFASTTGRAINTGIGCGAGTISSTSTGGTYVVGSTVTITLAGAPANTFALLVYSFDQKEVAPGVLLPLNLGFLGAASNCDLMVNPSNSFTIHGVDGAGATSNAFVIPPGIGQQGVGVQWGYLVAPTPTNTLGLEITSNRTIWIGPEVGSPNAGYVYDLFSNTTLTGTANVNACPVVQFILP
jgi:hypothetical protein